ncbi:lysophospholipid acyltransferase family protein [Candidatus Methylospira mobilis]|uniref:lysophospholipid acyltransferase family protein n=1 Tax=Candidatus Methylospira mobilis TaxID=1808979 RepID=UPI0028F10952|nr:lysophospholipid acyltransferase family protein [Candidatus Methylospira mobilis]WNV05809.1 lysophospholipid acyltransferase family protein [Candidatus Methylospira mobilis]
MVKPCYSDLCLSFLKAVFIIGLLLCGVIIVITVMPLLLNVPGGRKSALLAQQICSCWRKTACRILNIHTHITGAPCSTAGLVVANHISWLDIIAIGAQQPMIFIAKQEVSEWPVMGFLAANIGTLFVSRGDGAETRRTAEKMIWELRAGKRLMLFPEGTTTRGDQVLRFHPRLFHPAQQAQVLVQAVSVHYSGAAKEVAPFVGDDAFVPHLLKVIQLRRIDLHLHYCTPLSSVQERNRLAQSARAQIIDALQMDEAVKKAE